MRLRLATLLLCLLLCLWPCSQLRSVAAAARSPVVARWSVLDVIQWLESLGLAEHASRVEEEHIDGEALLELTMDEWAEQLGVVKLGHRKKIERGLRELREAEMAPAATSDHAAQIPPQQQPTPPVPAPAASPVQESVPKPEPKPQPPAPVDEPYVAVPLTRPPPAASSSKPKAKQKKTKAKSKPLARRKGEFISALSVEAVDALFDSVRVAAAPPRSRSLSASDESRLAELVREAVAAHQRHDYPLAKDRYEQVLQIQPAHARALHNLGLIAMQASPKPNLERALELLHQSLAIHVDPDLLVNLGSLYMGSKQTHEALVCWKRALDLNVLSGGPSLRVRFAEVLYAESLRLHGEGRVSECKSYLQYVALLCAEGLYAHFPAEWVPPMSQRAIDEFEAGAGGAGGAGLSSGDSAQVKANFISSGPLQLLATNLEVTHALRMFLADSWLHLGHLAEASIPADTVSRAEALAFFQRAREVKPTSADATKPVEARIGTVLAEAGQAAARIQSQLQGASQKAREQFAAEVARCRTGIMEHVLDPNGFDPRAPVLPVPSVLVPLLPSSPWRTRAKKLSEHLHKSCHTGEAFEVSRLINDDLVFHSSRWPHLFADEAELQRTRDGFERRLDTLLADPTMKNRWANGTGLEWCRFRFYTAYHGVNNRNLMEKLARVYRLAAPILEYTSPHLLADPTNGLSKRLQQRMSAGAVTTTNTHALDGRIRVAFISAFLFHHPVGKTLQGYIRLLPRDRFLVSAYRIALLPEEAHDPVLKSIRDSGVDVRDIPPEHWPQARATIDADRPDVLVYGDIGMEPTSYFLAFSRLAPIQALTFGHPDTSGIEGSMDYFLSHEGMELPDEDEAQSFYSEKLVRLPGVGWFARAIEPVEEKMDRAFFGLDDASLLAEGVDLPPLPSSSGASGQSQYTMYLVTKSVQFYSSVFLDALARILFEHPAAFLAILMDTGKPSRGYDMHSACVDHVGEGIERRLRRMRAAAGEIELDPSREARAAQDESRRKASRHPAADGRATQNDVLGSLVRSSAQPRPRPAVSGRVRFVDRGDHTYFMSLLRAADVLLQPFPLDGTTTTLEAVTIGTPTVVKQSRTVGGRMASAIYQHMHFTETCARSDEEYVQIAVRLGTDAAFQQHVRTQLREAAADPHRLFEDPNAIDAYAAWIEKAAADVVEQHAK